MEDGEWLSVTAAADLAAVSGDVMRQWVSRGRVDSHRTVSGRRIVRRSSLIALLDSGRVPE
jgi:hypothetical protein